MAAGTIRVELDGATVETTAGISVQQLLQQTAPADLGGDDPVVLASVNGRRVSLAEPLTGDERVRTVRSSHPLARTTVQRTVIFVLAAAAEDLFPDHELWINFSYGGGVYAELKRDEPLTAAEITALEQRMAEIRDEDLALTPQRLGMRAVLKIYERRGELRNYKAARYLRREAMTLYRMQGRDLLFYGRQLPSTGKIGAFRLQPEAPGFVLLTDNLGGGRGIPEFLPQPKLLKTLRDYARWLEALDLQDTGSLNEYIVQGRTAELIQISEARHAQFFVNAARHVGDMADAGRLVLLAGPSSSGKTSSAKRLMLQLRVLGFKPFALSLDDYFVDREDTPKGPDGDYDYESLEALKVDAVQRAPAGPDGRRRGAPAEVRLRLGPRAAGQGADAPGAGPAPDRRGHPRPEPAADPGDPGGGEDADLRVGPLPHEHHQPQLHPHQPHPAVPAHRARRPVPRLHRQRDPGPLAQGARTARTPTSSPSRTTRTSSSTRG